MNRRDALTALGTLASTTGLSLTPVTTREADGAELVILKCKGRVTHEQALRIRETWRQGMEGTALEHVRAVVIDDAIDVEIIRRS